MGDRRKSWLSALIEGIQSVAVFSGLAILFLGCFNVLYHYENTEYFYLLGFIFIVSFLVSLPRTMHKLHLFFRRRSKK